MRLLNYFIVTTALIVCVTNFSKVHAQGASTGAPILLKGVVEKVLEEETQTKAEGEVINQTLYVNMGNQNVTAFYTVLPLTGKEKISVGDSILIYGVQMMGETKYFVADYNRERPIVLLIGLFVGIVVLVTRRWGIMSLVGMLYSFLIIFRFILPQILNGKDPLVTALIGVVMIAPVTFSLSHGLNKKTIAGILGTFIALSVTGLLAVIFTQIAHLSGFGSEESLFLQISQGNKLNMQGVFLAGIIIGTLGILDDVTISQASIVKQLKVANQNLSKTDLYLRAMSVGHDHISSAVNTLVLVYTGASMPLLLIFLLSNQSFGGAINYQVITEEIVRTLVGSIGLVIAVPITTLIAAIFLDSSDEHEEKTEHTHHH